MNHLKPYLWAQAELNKNIKEVKGYKHNLRVLFYHSFTTLKASDDETPWCSSFMCAAHEESGFKSTRSAAAISWGGYGIPIPIKDAQIGDIVVLKRYSSKNPDARHVAFLDKVIKEGDKYCQLLGGNQNDSVSISKNHYKVSDIETIRRTV